MQIQDGVRKMVDPDQNSLGTSRPWPGARAQLRHLGGSPWLASRLPNKCTVAIEAELDCGGKPGRKVIYL